MEIVEIAPQYISVNVLDHASHVHWRGGMEGSPSGRQWCYGVTMGVVTQARQVTPGGSLGWWAASTPYSI